MTEVERNVDIKLKMLIQACKETGNFKKITVTGFILLSNKIQEIALKLGMRPRNEAKDELLFDYMNMVNELFKKNLKVQIFNPDIFESVKKIELLFLRNRGDLPKTYTRELLRVYYLLRKFEIPNLYKSATGEGYFEDSNLNMLNFLSPNARKNKNKNTSKFRPLILQKVREQERALQNTLNNKLDQTNLERALFLKKLKEGITKSGNSKISLRGVLKDSVDYNQSPSIFIKYFMIGFALLCALCGIMILIEALQFPFISDVLSQTLFIFFGVIVVLILLYRMFTKR
ncbi:hypothetical protein LCGC14_2334850 [marine sediment metagenome]|uniref:Uncharacterized protein n=1 Tax=marine sediment metagenome TaxID=412755 RepID=A0A0F9F8S0_9ZZZZ